MIGKTDDRVPGSMQFVLVQVMFEMVVPAGAHFGETDGWVPVQFGAQVLL